MSFLEIYLIEFRMVKEDELPSDKAYVFGYHPHGIIGMDLLQSMGICSVTKRSCERILRKGPGNAITIVVGGAAESLNAHPGTSDLILKKRLGFIKIAIREGANLVPVFSFVGGIVLIYPPLNSAVKGENDIYQQLATEDGSTIHKLQKTFQKIFGFTLPLFHGRDNLGLMPYRHPIVSVVGKAIEVEQTSNPSQEMLEDVQSRYIDELMRIWDKYKDIYAANRTLNVFVTSPDTHSERRFLRNITLSELRARLEPIVGIPSQNQTLTLDGVLLMNMNLSLVDAGVRELSTLTVGDITDEKNERGGQYTDVSQVEKYDMTDEEYKNRSDTVLAYKKANEIGRFSKAAAEAEKEPLPEHIKYNDDDFSLIGSLARIGQQPLKAAISARQYSQKPAPAEKASSLIDSLPGNSVVSKTGSVVLGTGLTAAAISQELYVVNEESILAIGSLILFAYIAKIAREPYNSWASSQIEKMKNVLNASRTQHTEAVQSRINNVGELKDVVNLTKSLFALSKETAQTESKVYELTQQNAVNAEVKSVLDSWVRFEAQERESEQAQLTQTVINNINKQISDEKFQKDTLTQAVAEIEQLVKDKKI
ncbi:hypothetical protein E3Q22_01601 [Wallemia mellicola]|uniref:ATP synthase subunit 4, mitochondrial n=1 Tax=Wallemia mellicola TaxID=1708541 RepID=A0A4T0M0A1_9BASI|nr:hypothetical protein E3Q23_02121 [Wallemia mellicola]TIB80968.1 hypothetical protein E3Q22_01601 [Wallemia mellicola]TIB88005.1 hypothetical protein E3Q21_01097 [Wallemia mellicola]TIB90789.1 hypothetical protein E3Q20_01084 [Wallemia mellicola]TIC25005.1 hypothetical protein E3Q12_01201 [Wallemia mellicola]